MDRLLVIACSERKLADEGPMAAVERYDGPAFRVLRKYLRGASIGTPTVLILSAKFGLIPSAQAIPYYDFRLTKESAASLQPQVTDALSAHLSAQKWDSIAVCAGKDYRVALEGLPALVREGTRLETLAGGLGVRLTNLKKWLHDGA